MCLRTTIKHFLKLFPEISCGFENKNRNFAAWIFNTVDYEAGRRKIYQL